MWRRWYSIVLGLRNSRRRGLAGGLAAGQQQRDLELLRREFVDRARVRRRSVSPSRPARSRARSAHGRASSRSNASSAARSCSRARTRLRARRSALAVGQLCPRRLERVGGLGVSSSACSKRLGRSRSSSASEPLAAVARAPATTAAPWPRRPPSAGRRSARASSTRPEPDVRVDELGRRRQVGVGDPQLARAVAADARTAPPPGRVAEPQLELPECARDPHLVEPDAEPMRIASSASATQRAAFRARVRGGPAATRAPPVRTASSAAGRSRGRARSPRDRWTRQPPSDRWWPGRGRSGCSRTSGSTPTAARARALEGLLEQRAPGAASRRKIGAITSHGSSRRSSRDLRRALGERHRFAAIATAPAAASPPITRAIPTALAARKRARGDASAGQRFAALLGQPQHLGRLAGVEAGAGGLGEHRHRPLGVGPRRRPPSGSRGRASPAPAGSRCGRRVRRSATSIAVASVEARASSSSSTAASGRPGQPAASAARQQQPSPPLGVGRQSCRPARTPAAAVA